MSWEEKILKYLVENYRKSKKDGGDNKINRRTQVKPEKFYKKYLANDGAYEVIRAINETVDSLAKRGFLTYKRENFGTQLKTIYLVDEQIKAVEGYLCQKYDFVSKGMKRAAVQEIIDQYHDSSTICQQECDLLQQALNNNKIPSNYEAMPLILEAIKFIEHNQTELYVREASAEIYGDSKYFGENTLKPVCEMLRKYKNKPCEEEELLDEILNEYGIKKESQKLCLKGDFVICVGGKELDFSVLPEGIELDAKALDEITAIKIDSPKFMTIENRTSYLRYSAPDTVTFYLGGYHNRFQRDFIKKVYESNPNLEYLHFGDIDAGGFWIYQNLCKVTDVRFKTFCMSKVELLNEEFQHCLHPLTDMDIVRLRGLERVGEHADTIKFMLENNVKLEQEIISLKLMNSF